MKVIKKIMYMLLVFTMTIGMSMTAFAEEPAISPRAVETNGVITVSGEQLKGKDVTIVRMFTGNIGPEGTTVGYTLESAWQNFFNQQLHKDGGENVTSQEAYEHVSKLQSESSTTVGTSLIEFAKQAKAYYKEHSSDFTGLSQKNNAGDIDSVTFNNVKSGYYLVIPASGSTGADRVTDAMLVNVRDNKPATIKLKTEYPTVEKTVTPDGGNSTSAQIGDELTFKLTSNVPNMADYSTYKFTFKDTMSKGLTLDKDSITITIGGQPVNKDVDYKVTTSTSEAGETLLGIIFENLKNVTAATVGAEIKVEYTATLNENAQMGNDGNTNKAELEYSNDPSTDSVGKSEPDMTYTYTFEIKVHKYANNDTGKLLPGAIFQLQTADGTPIKLVKVKESDTDYRVANDEDLDTVESFQTVATGDIQIKGLKAGKYKLKEIEAPEGYNKLTNPTEFEIQTQYNDDGTMSVGYAKYAVDGKNATESNIVNIQNKSGAFLPETGSIGTIGLTIAGVALIIGGIGFTSRKKKEQE